MQCLLYATLNSNLLFFILVSTYEWTEVRVPSSNCVKSLAGIHACLPFGSVIHIWLHTVVKRSNRSLKATKMRVNQHQQIPKMSTLEEVLLIGGVTMTLSSFRLVCSCFSFFWWWGCWQVFDKLCASLLKFKLQQNNIFEKKNKTKQKQNRKQEWLWGNGKNNWTRKSFWTTTTPPDRKTIMEI